MGLATSAIIKLQSKTRRKFKSSDSRRRPKVFIAVELAAESLRSAVGICTQRGLGMTETSAPVSIKKNNLVELSKILRRQFLEAPLLVVDSLGEIIFLLTLGRTLSTGMNKG